MSGAMTAEQATTFEKGTSLINSAQLVAEAVRRGCSCAPYVDWFTYKRWKAQGFQVQKGEKGFPLPIFVPVKDEEGNVIRTRPWTSHLFCRCQTKPS